MDGTALTVFAKHEDDSVAKANNTLKRVEVFTSLSLLSVNVKKHVFTDIV